MINFGEWLPDLPEYKNEGLTDINNAIPDARGYQSLPSLTMEATGVGGQPLGAISIRDTGSSGFTYAGDGTNLYRHSGSAWTTVSKAGGYTATEDWEFAKWGDKVIAVSKSIAPQIADVGSGLFADLTGTPPQGSRLGIVGDFVVIGDTQTGTPNGSNVVFWSDINDETNWTSGQSDFQELQGNGGEIKKIVGGDYGVVFQETSIWRMDYVGAPLIFQFSEVETNRGTRAPRSVVHYGNSTYYLGHDDFYMFNGSGSRPLGVNKITQTFFGDLNKDALDKVSGAFDVERQLIVWAYPSSGASMPNKILMYHWPTGKWSQGEVDTALIFSLIGEGVTLDGLDAISADIDALTASLDSSIWQGGNLLIGAMSQYTAGAGGELPTPPITSKLSSFSGAALTARFITGEMELNNGQRMMVTEARPMVEGGASEICIGHRSRLEDTVQWTAKTQTNEAGFTPQRINDRYIRFRLDTLAEFDHANGLEIKAVGRGKR